MWNFVTYFQCLKYSLVYYVVVFLCPITYRKLNSKLAYRPVILYSLSDLFAKYFHVLSIHDSEAVSLRFLFIVDVLFSFFVVIYYCKVVESLECWFLPTVPWPGDSGWQSFDFMTLFQFHQTFLSRVCSQWTTSIFRMWRYCLPALWCAKSANFSLDNKIPLF